MAKRKRTIGQTFRPLFVLDLIQINSDNSNNPVFRSKIVGPFDFDTARFVCIIII